MTTAQQPIIGIYWIALTPEEKDALAKLTLSYKLANTRLNDMRSNFLFELLTDCQVNLGEYADLDTPESIRKALLTAWQSIIEIIQSDRTYQNILFLRINKDSMPN